MKPQALTSKNNLFIFIVILLICSLQNIGYADLAFMEDEPALREIAENTPAGANIGSPLRYSAEGVHGCLRATLSGPDASAFRFQHFYRAVQLKTRSALDYETENTYNVTVTISGGGYSDTIDVTILVTDVDDTQPNNPPIFPSDGTTRAIVEGTLADRNIGAPVSATDPDGDTLTYSLSENSDGELFNIDASSGQLKTKAALDHKTKPQCMVKIEVSDGKGGTDSINVTINVLEAERPDPIMFVRQDGVPESDQTVKPGTFELVMDFGQPMTGFEQTELGINDFNTDATITGWQQSTNGEDYIATVSAPEVGQITFTVPANAAQTVANSQGNIERLLTVFVKVSGELAVKNSGVPPWNINQDNRVNSIGVVGATDVLRTHAAYIKASRSDVNQNGSVDLVDMHQVRTNLEDDVIVVPDVNLAAALRENLALNPDEPITTWEMETLRILAVPRHEISDITGLEHATYLTSLSLQKNSIQDLSPIANLNHLIYLRLNENQIDDVQPLANLESLQRLRLADNPVIDLSPLYPLTQQNLVDVDLEITEYPPWDVNQDGVRDYRDLNLIIDLWNAYLENPEDTRGDLNRDGVVDIVDFHIVFYSKPGAPPPPYEIPGLPRGPGIFDTLDRDTLQAQLQTLRAESDGSPKSQQAIAFLERLLVSGRPQKTQLLANYPNPFNPETWIPYHLAKAADVKITIYNTHGIVVRHLALGHQSAGYYTSHSQAAYWDGCNNLGERVGSGVYFYQLHANYVSPIRKMVILK